MTYSRPVRNHRVGLQTNSSPDVGQLPHWLELMD